MEVKCLAVVSPERVSVLKKTMNMFGALLILYFMLMVNALKF